MWSCPRQISEQALGPFILIVRYSARRRFFDLLLPCWCGMVVWWFPRYLSQVPVWGQAT